MQISRSEIYLDYALDFALKIYLQSGITKFRFWAIQRSLNGSLRLDEIKLVILKKYFETFYL